MKESENPMVIEKDTLQECHVTYAGTLGYGNPESSISFKKQLESGELTEEVATRAEQLIESGECMTLIQEIDDGCIDGRPTIELMYVNENAEFYTKTVSSNNHERAKVAGGGYLTSLAMVHALEGQTSSEVDEDLKMVTVKLNEAGLFCGVHTGAHGHGEKTDCGANDRYLEILRNGVLYREWIEDTTASLLDVAGITYNSSTAEKIYSNWDDVSEQEEYFTKSTGASRFSVIENSIKNAQDSTGDYSKPIAVSKHLGGDHKEDFIILNYVDGKTFSQQKFAQQMKKDFPDIPDVNLAQAFVVDVPRIIALAKALTQDKPDSEETFSVALYAGIKYQLATAATLTDGSLKNYIITE